MRNYTLHEVKTIAAWMRDAASRLEIYGAFCLTAVSTQLQASTTSGERVGGGDVSDPTGTRATTNVGSNAWLEREQAHLKANLGTALDVSQAIVEGTGRIYSHVTPEKDHDVDPDEKCRQGCGERKTPGRQGNCSACAQWLRANPDPNGMRRDSVPPQVLDNRKTRTRKRTQAESMESVA